MDSHVATSRLPGGNAARNSRTPQACSKCRKKKAKCDGIRPACGRCRKARTDCRWVRGSWSVPELASTPSDPPGAFDDAGSPSMNMSARSTHGPHEALPSLPKPTGERPSLSLANRCVELFFHHHHDLEFCSFMHKPSFSIDSADPFLVSAIVTLSSLYLPSTFNAEEHGFSSVHRLTTKYHLATRQFSRATSDIPSISSIQANLILALFEALSSSESLAWMYSGVAVRMAQAMRLTQEYHDTQSPQEREVRRRTFWACFIVDRLVAFSTARQTTIRLEHVGVRLPCSQQSFSFGEEEEPGLHMYDLEIEPRSRLRMNVPTFFLMTLNLWSCMSELLITGRRRLRFTPTDPNSPFRRCERALEEWVAGLPSRFRWSSTNYEIHRSFGQGKMFVAAHILLCHAFVVTHQEYLPQSEEPLDESGGIDRADVPLTYRDERLISVCLHKVDQMVAIMDCLTNGDTQAIEDLRSPFSALAMLSEASVHLWSSFTEEATASTSYNQRDRVQLNFDTLKSWAFQWQMARGCTLTLEIICALYEYAYTGVRTETFLQGSLGSENNSTGSDGEEVSPQYHGRCGDGYPNVGAHNQRLYDKIRLVLIGPLNRPEMKRALLQDFLGNMWQHASISRRLAFIDTIFPDFSMEEGFQ